MVEETQKKKTGIATIRHIIEYLYQFISCINKDRKELEILYFLLASTSYTTFFEFVVKVTKFLIDTQLGFSCKLTFWVWPLRLSSCGKGPGKVCGRFQFSVQ